MKCPDCNEEVLNVKAHAMNRGHVDLLGHLMVTSFFAGISDTREEVRRAARDHRKGSCHYCAMEQETTQ